MKFTVVIGMDYHKDSFENLVEETKQALGSNNYFKVEEVALSTQNEDFICSELHLVVNKKGAMKAIDKLFFFTSKVVINGKSFCVHDEDLKEITDFLDNEDDRLQLEELGKDKDLPADFKQKLEDWFFCDEEWFLEEGESWNTFDYYDIAVYDVNVYLGSHVCADEDEQNKVHLAVYAVDSETGETDNDTTVADYVYELKKQND